MNGKTSLLVDSERHLQIFTEHDLDAKYQKPQTKRSIKERIHKTAIRECSCNGERLKNFLFSVLPILTWLPKYDIRNDILRDIAAGLTVGVVHIPQGLAYGLLATLPPIAGIYVSFFPVILYPLFGTSRHISMGTFAVVSLLVSAVLDERVPASYCGESNIPFPVNTTTLFATSTIPNGILNTTDVPYEGSAVCQKLYEARKLEVATALSICVGVLQVAMHIFRLGLVTLFLSDSLVSGFVSGASIHVVTSQIPKLFGINVQRHTGYFAMIYTYVDFFSNITTVVWGTVAVSVGCLVFLIVGKELNFRFKKKLPLPIPWELGIVIITTIASRFGHLEKDHGVVTVGAIPTGIAMSVPRGSDVAMLFFDAIPLAIVAFTVEISLCQLFATKHGYKIQSNQEVLALGICNIFGAFFSCFPSAASLSRSVIYEEIGGKTQLGSYFSSAVVLSVLLWIGPLFEPLPQAALAVIIIVNIKSIAMMWRNVKPLWKISRLDAITWIVAWLSVVLLGVATGLITGVAFSVFTVLIRTRNATGASLQKVSSTGQYRDRKKYDTVSLNEKLFVFQFTGPIYFANRDRFTEQLYSQLGYDPVKTLAIRKASKTSPANQRRQNNNRETDSNLPNGGENRIVVSYSRIDTVQNSGDACEIIKDFATANDNLNDNNPACSASDDVEVSHVVFDMGQCSFMDSDGAKLVGDLYDTFNGLDMELLLASCNENVKTSLHGLCRDKDHNIVTYVSLQKAIEFALKEILSSSTTSNNTRADSSHANDNIV